MNSENKPSCPSCQLTLHSDEDLSQHSCIVKQETLEGTTEYCIYDDSDLELSEQFLITILRQVDILCETIENGDPSLERRIKVNKNLNNSVSCYKDTLISYKTKNVKEEIIVDLQPADYDSHSEDELKQEFEDETYTEDNEIQGMEF